MRWILTRTERTVAALTLLLVGVAGCSKVADPLPAGSTSDTPRRGGTLRTAAKQNVRTLDAAVAFDTSAAAIEGLIYDQLVSYDHEMKLVPQLAERFEVGAKGLTYRFWLRPEARFHDGDIVTAADVKRSLERAFHPETPCPVPSYFSAIDGFAEYHSGKAAELAGVVVEGKHQLLIRLSRPDATFLHVLALPIAAPLCKSAGRRYDPAFSREACGAGPFKLSRFEHDRVISLVRHDDYWDRSRPYLDAIEWQLSMKPLTQRFKFERGDLDYVRDLETPDIVQYLKAPAWKGHGAFETPLTSLGSFLNTELPPFNDRHFRRAVAFAIDRKEIASLRPGFLLPLHHIVPEALLRHGPNDGGQRHDRKRALEEMRLAGFPYDPTTDHGGYPHMIPYLAVVDNFSQQAAEVMQQQLARVGIRIRIELVSWPTFLTRASRRKTAPMGRFGWHADYPEPSTFLEPILSSRAIQAEESMNTAFFSHQRFDRLVFAARRSLDPATRESLYRKAERIALQEAPLVATFSSREYELWQPYLRGYRPHPVLSRHVRHAWLAAPQQHARRHRAATRSVGVALAGPRLLRRRAPR